MITQTEVRAILEYRPETGEFFWRQRRGNVRAGSPAGCLNHAIGYRQIGIGGRNHYAHRLAFIYMTGAAPEFVDHVNRDRSDNRWANLRPATQAQNNVNSGMPRHNTSGIRGVQWCRGTGKWRAVVSVGNRPRHIGRFRTKEAAAAAYAAAVVALHGEYAPDVGASDRHA